MIYKSIRAELNNVDSELPLGERLSTIYTNIEGKLNAHDREAFVKSYRQVLRAIDLFLSGHRTEAYNTIYSNFYSGEGLELIKLFILKKGSMLYRMRSADYYTQYQPEQMYHIPFEERYKVGNERYSVSGLPSLYLSSSVYGSWEESKRANIDFSNVACFKAMKDMYFIDMVLPEDSKTILEYDKLPLVIACLLKVAKPNSKFTPEYIIPQLVMDCIITARDSYPDLCGVRYESNFQNRRDLLYSPQDNKELFINYAIPPFVVRDKGICPKIKEILHLSGITSYAEIKLRNIQNKLVDSNKDPYKNSLFGLLETHLAYLTSIDGMLTYHDSK